MFCVRTVCWKLHDVFALNALTFLLSLLSLCCIGHQMSRCSHCIYPFTLWHCLLSLWYVGDWMTISLWKLILLHCRLSCLWSHRNQKSRCSQCILRGLFLLWWWGHFLVVILAISGFRRRSNYVTSSHWTCGKGYFPSSDVTIWFLCL